MHCNAFEKVRFASDCTTSQYFKSFQFSSLSPGAKKTSTALCHIMVTGETSKAENDMYEPEV